jgi:hypothetical protein
MRGQRNRENTTRVRHEPCQEVVRRTRHAYNVADPVCTLRERGCPKKSAQAKEGERNKTLMLIHLGIIFNYNLAQSTSRLLFTSLIVSVFLLIRSPLGLCVENALRPAPVYFPSLLASISIYRPPSMPIPNGHSISPLDSLFIFVPFSLPLAGRPPAPRSHRVSCSVGGLIYLQYICHSPLLSSSSASLRSSSCLIT